MSEAALLAAAGEAVQREGFSDQLVAAGQFSPRGSSGGLFAGGMIGDSIGGTFGGAADAIGLAGGSLAGRRAAGRSAGLPTDMIVAVSSGWVYGFAGRSRSREPGPMAFRVPRVGLTVTVRQRLNVRLLELTGPDGSRISLEGNRLPITHSNDVIKELAGKG